MAQIQRTVVTLRFHGDDLNPMELSDRLGAIPSKAHEKGATLQSASGARIAKMGIWNLTVEADAPDGFEELVTRLFGQLSPELDTWLDLSGRFAGDLFVGLFLGRTNEGLPIGRETLGAIASRGLKLGFDIYGPTNE
jgi:hypothetical protein